MWSLEKFKDDFKENCNGKEENVVLPDVDLPISQCRTGFRLKIAIKLKKLSLHDALYCFVQLDELNKSLNDSDVKSLLKYIIKLSVDTNKFDQRLFNKISKKMNGFSVKLNIFFISLISDLNFDFIALYIKNVADESVDSELKQYSAKIIYKDRLKWLLEVLKRN